MNVVASFFQGNVVFALQVLSLTHELQGGYGEQLKDSVNQKERKKCKG